MVTTVNPMVATVGRYLFPVLMALPGRQSWPQDADCPLATEPGAWGRRSSSPSSPVFALPDGYQF